MTFNLERFFPSLSSMDNSNTGGGDNKRELPTEPEKREVEQKMPTFVESLQQTLTQTNERYLKRLPDNYAQIQEHLIKEEIVRGKERLTMFHGGPLKWDKQGINDAWITPIEYVCLNEKGETVRLNFHLLTINCQQGENTRDVAAQLNLASDDELKLRGLSEDAYLLKRYCFVSDGQSRALLRPSVNGSFAFPIITTSADLTAEKMSASAFDAAVKMIADHLSLNMEKSDFLNDGQRLIEEQGFAAKEQIDDFRVAEERVIDTEQGKVFVTEVIFNDDSDNAWKTYKIYSCQPLATVDKEASINLRVDSGCDIGMNYEDGGCDCHQQLLSALQVMRTNGGVVIHLASQDGRGYGLNTKMQTEGMKWGLDVVTKKRIPRMRTTDAAEGVFGGNYDIRSYRSAGVILKKLGFTRARLWTDNKGKLWPIESAFGKGKVEQVHTDSILKAMENGEDPQGIAQMLLKLATDSKYQGGISEETLEKFLTYIGTSFSSRETREEKLRKVGFFLNGD